MQKEYDPTKYYIDVENHPFCPIGQRKHDVNYTEEVINRI